MYLYRECYVGIMLIEVCGPCDAIVHISVYIIPVTAPCIPHISTYIIPTYQFLTCYLLFDRSMPLIQSYEQTVAPLWTVPWLMGASSPPPATLSSTGRGCTACGPSRWVHEWGLPGCRARRKDESTTYKVVFFKAEFVCHFLLLISFGILNIWVKFIYIFIYLVTYLSNCIYLHIYLYIYLSAYLLTNLSIYTAAYHLVLSNSCD